MQTALLLHICTFSNLVLVNELACGIVYFNPTNKYLKTNFIQLFTNYWHYKNTNACRTTTRKINTGIIILHK